MMGKLGGQTGNGKTTRGQQKRASKLQGHGEEALESKGDQAVAGPEEREPGSSLPPAS